MRPGSEGPAGATCHREQARAPHARVRGSPGSARVWAHSSSACGCSREGAGQHVEPLAPRRRKSGKAVEAGLLQARHPGSFIAWGRARQPAPPQTPAPGLLAPRRGPSPAAASSSGSLLGSPWRKKGDGEEEDAGRAGEQGEAAGCWRCRAVLATDRLLPAPPVHSAPQHLPPRPGHGLPPWPTSPGTWHSQEQLLWFRCCMELQPPCQGS